MILFQMFFSKIFRHDFYALWFYTSVSVKRISFQKSLELLSDNFPICRLIKAIVIRKNIRISNLHYLITHNQFVISKLHIVGQKT